LLKMHVGAGPPLRHPNPGCLTLRVFRRVSTTDIDISRLLSPAVRPSGFRSPAQGLALRSDNAGSSNPTVPVRAPVCALPAEKEIAILPAAKQRAAMVTTGSDNVHIQRRSNDEADSAFGIDNMDRTLCCDE
jgi:hypothetical protein